MATSKFEIIVDYIGARIRFYCSSLKKAEEIAYREKAQGAYNVMIVQMNVHK